MPVLIREKWLQLTENALALGSAEILDKQPSIR